MVEDQKETKTLKKPVCCIVKYQCPRCRSCQTTCLGYAMDVDRSKRWSGFYDLFEWECDNCGMFWLQRYPDERRI